MAAKVHGLVLGFDHAFSIRDALQKIFSRKLGIEAYVDRKTLFNVVAKDGSMTEKRLKVDIAALRESYANGGEIQR